MKDQDLALALGRFFGEVRRETKGLATKVVLWLYGTENDFSHGLDEGGEELEHGLRKFPKDRIDFETYVALYGAGALQGHMSGAAERKPGGGWTGRLEEKREISYIHLLLPPQFGPLKSQCGLDYPGLNARCSIMNAEPHRTSAILLFQEYLRSVYRSVAGADAETLVEHLEDLPGHRPADELFGQWQEIEAKLKSEKRPALYEVRDGRFFVYEKQGKTKRLVNGWVFGLAPEAAPEEAGAAELQSDYEKRIVEATLQARLRLLVAETARLFGAEGKDLVALAAEQATGALPKFLSSAEHLVELAETNQMQEQHHPVARAVLERIEKIHALVGRHSRLLAGRGIDAEAIRETLVLAQKLKRRL